MGAFNSIFDLPLPDGGGSDDELGPDVGGSDDRSVGDAAKSEVEEHLKQLVKGVVQEIESKNESVAATLVDDGLNYAKRNGQSLTREARECYAVLHMLKSKLIFNPFCPFDSMEQLDSAIWVSKGPSSELAQFAIGWNRMFYNWCQKNFCWSAQLIIGYFEKKVRWLNRLHETDPVESAASILMLSTQCCELASCISPCNTRVIRKTVLVDLYMKHAELLMVKNRIESAKHYINQALVLGGNSAKLRLLAAEVDLQILKSVSPSSGSFEKLCKETDQNITKGLELESQLKQEFLQLRGELGQVIQRSGKQIPLGAVRQESESSCPEIERERKRQEDAQKKKREAFQEKRAKASKTKTKLVSRQRHVSGSCTADEDVEEIEVVYERRRYSVDCVGKKKKVPTATLR